MLNMLIVDEIIKNALIEDINYMDLASDSIFTDGHRSQALATAKEDGVICGLTVFERVFKILNPDIKVTSFIKDGDLVTRGTDICSISGSTKDILKGERVALNLLQRMSGISTLSRKYAREVSGMNVKIADTRKTTPGLRVIEKYAVRMGGCFNHRFNLSDMIMLKDNHIFASGGIAKAVSKARENVGHTVKIEVEVETTAGLMEAVDAGADVIMLDNMDLKSMRESVDYVKNKFQGQLIRPVVEASGNVNLDTVRSIAETGVDVISCGKLTHSVFALDISLNMDMKKKSLI